MFVCFNQLHTDLNSNKSLKPCLQTKHFNNTNVAYSFKPPGSTKCCLLRKHKVFYMDVTLTPAVRRVTSTAGKVCLGESWNELKSHLQRHRPPAHTVKIILLLWRGGGCTAVNTPLLYYDQVQVKT